VVTTISACGYVDPTPEFTAKARDQETGLDFFGARYYGSALGRFTSPDPENASGLNHLEDPQSWNAYSYVRNNPLRYTDPDGQDWTVCEGTSSRNQTNCGTITNDKSFENYASSQGWTVKGGGLYDSNGDQIGTAHWSPSVDPTAGNAVAFLNFTIGAMASNYAFGAAEAGIGIGAGALAAARLGRTAVRRRRNSDHSRQSYQGH
jgi:RHS repeat-associated protein